MAGLQRAFKEIIDREHRYYATPPEVIDVHILPNGAMSYVPAVPDTAAAAMVDHSMLQVPAEERGNKPLHAAQVQHIDLFKDNPNVDEGVGRARGLRNRIVVRDGAAQPADTQHFNLFNVNAAVAEDPGKPRCLRPIYKIWGENEGPRRTDQRAHVRRRRATHQLGKWMRHEDGERLRKRYESKLNNKHRVPVAVLRARPHAKPVRPHTARRAASPSGASGGCGGSATARKPWGAGGQRASEVLLDTFMKRVDDEQAAMVAARDAAPLPRPRPDTARGSGKRAAAALHGDVDVKPFSPPRPHTAREARKPVTGPIAARVPGLTKGRAEGGPSAEPLAHTGVVVPTPPPPSSRSMRSRGHNARMKAQINMLYNKFFGGEETEHA